MSAQKLITEHLDLWASATTQAANGRGKNGKVELTGIQKLRELILELAVRGKLTPQSRDDKPADEFLAEICDGQAMRVREPSRGTQNGGEHSEKNKDEFLLPGGWTWTDLNCVARIIGGGTPKSKEPAYWTDDGIKWLTPADLYGHNEKYIGSGKRDISESGLKNSSAQLLPARSVLFSSRAPIGHVAIAKNELCTNQGFKSCIPYHDGMSEYLYYFLKRSAKHIDAAASGTTFKEISGSKMARVRVALPPLPEQHRIVQRVDELMALCDRLEQQTSDQLEAHETLVDTLLNTLTQSENATELANNWARLAAHFDTLFTTERSIDKLKQTILQLAVMGRLVEQLKGYPPSVELLNTIDFRKSELEKTGELKRTEALPDIAPQEMPPRLPQNWSVTRLGRVAFQITDGAHHTPTYVSRGIPFLSVKDMSKGNLDFSDTRHISEEKHRELSQRCNPKRGDLLITKVGTTGIPILVDVDSEFSIFVSVALIKFPTDLIDGRFLKLLIASPWVRKQSEEGTEGVGNKNLVLKKIRNFILPIPPLEEQKFIVQKVDELMALCNQIKECLHHANETRCQLAETVVEGALN